MNDSPIKGITIMIGAVFLIVIMNMFAKLVSDSHGPIEIAFWRNLFALILLLAMVAYKRDFEVLKTKRLKGQLLRGSAGTIGLIMVFWSYSLMPMADVVAIMFISGILTTILSATVLKEKVGVLRWSAVVLGFIGAVIAAYPSGDDWNIKGVLVALTAAFIGGAVISMMLRSLGKTERATTTVFYFLIIGLIMTAPYVLWLGKLPDMQTFYYLIACGITGGISLIWKTQAFRYAEASLLSPIPYTSIIWATIIGYLVWNDLPTVNVIIGVFIIISSNLFILWRTSQVKKVKDNG